MPRHLVPALAALIAIPSLVAEEAPGPGTDNAITISATRLDEDPLAQPYAYYRHTAGERERAVGRTALERINYGPGVFVQSTAPNQFSPFIRGLTGEQTLLRIDGIRLSHATMRPGPNQYAALVPGMSVGAIDAVLGASAAATGSDGLTGLLDFRLAETGRGVEKPVSPWIGARVDHANGSQMSAGIDGVGGDWAYSVEGGYHHFHDRIGGKDSEDHLSGVDNGDQSIPNTAYDQYHGAARIAWFGIEDHRFDLKLGHTRQEDAPRPDGYAANSGADDRISRYFDHHTYTYTHLGHTWTPEAIDWIDAWRSTLWYHRNDETQIRERERGPGYRREEKEDTTSGIGLETEISHRFGAHELRYGLEFGFESTANEYARFEGVDEASAVRVGEGQDDQRTSIPDGSEYNSVAVFAQDQWWFAEEWELLIGARFTAVSWDSEVDGRGGFADTERVDGSASDLSGGVRLGWHFHDDMLAFAGLGKSFRAPNLTNLTGIVDRGSSGIAVVGNGDLDPEVAYTAELGWKYHRERDVLQVTTFVTTIDDLIQPVYSDTDGDGDIDSGRMENAEGADLAGFELAWDYGLPVTEWLPGSERVALVGATSLVDTEIDLTQDDGSIKTEPMSRSNRLYGFIGIAAEFERGWWLRPQIRWHDRYDDVAESDAGDVRLTMAGTDEGEVPGYAVIDLVGGWRSLDGGQWVTVTLENLGDKTYREAGSAADGPGFNLGLAGGARF